MCEALRWSVLPVAGGLYDQHPRLLEEWTVIFEERERHRKTEEAKAKRSKK